MLRHAAVLVGLVPLLAAAAPPDPYAALAAERAEGVKAQAHEARGAAAMVRLHALKDEIEDLSLLSKAFADVSVRSREPLNRALARELLLDVELARGRTQQAEALSRELGFLHDFYVVGGFENEGRSGCDRDFGPEATVAAGGEGLKNVYAGVGHEVGWRKLSGAPMDGRIDLSGAIQPSRETVAYALTYLEARGPTHVSLALGTSGGHRLWVNGALVSRSEGEHPARPDQARVSVPLRAGSNSVLLKICQDEGALAFYLREESGGKQAKVTLPTKLPKLARARDEHHVLPTSITLLERAAQKDPNDAGRLADLAVVLAHLRPYDARERLAAVTAEKAVAMAPHDVDVRLLAAALEEDDANIRRAHLETARTLAPTSPRTLFALAHHELSRGFPERARPLIDEALHVAPDFAAAELELARVEEEWSDWASASARVESVYRRFPRLPHAAREAARVARRMDRLNEAVERYRVALALRFDDADSRQLLASALADLGQVEPALAVLQQAVELSPFEPEASLRLGELADANGMAEVGAHAFAAARALAPDQPEVHEREARALLHAGQRDEAIRAFEQALALRPQNPGLREVVRTLKNERSSYGAQYLAAPLTLVKEADSYAGEDAVVLADITHVRVQSSGLSSRLHQIAVKVYSERGVEAFRHFPIPYAPSRQEVRVLKARVVKPDGSIADGHGENDRAMNEPWSGMYYDARAKVLTFPALAKGDVLELQYRLEDTAQENLLSDYFGDVEYVQGTAPKLRYAFLVDMPSGRPLFWNRTTLPPGISVGEERQPDGRVLYRFEAKSVSRVLPEPGMPGWGEVVATLHVSTYKTWDEVGRYYWGLVRGQLVRSEELRKTVEQSLKGIDRRDTRAVVRALYDFVVSQTRYVALEFGIHGFQPYRVDRVLARRFGDCKDKASLLSVMLAEAGVNSRLVLLRMRHLGKLAEEPASLAAFNHAIVYVPSLDLYLDGTAEFHGAQELPSADRLANVLIVEPGGKSRFVITPEGRSEENLTSLQLNVTLKADGTAAVTGESRITGLSAPEYRRSYRAAATRKATFEQGWGQAFPGLRVDEVSLSDLSRLDQDVSLHYRLSVPRYAEVLPQGLRFHPFGTGRAYTQTFAPLVERKFDLVLDHPWVNRFQVEYALPASFELRGLPPEVFEETPFGRYRLRVEKVGNLLRCSGEVAFTVSRIPARDYAAFRAFLGRVDQAFARRLVVDRAPPAAATAAGGL